jgi:hypothetical protein
MKSFKEFINEVQEPLSKGEANFKHMHNPINHKDLVPGVTDQDHVFNGTPQRKDPRTASYENDESEKAYDKNLKADTVEEASLAALAPPRDKVTKKDVLVGRGVLKKHHSDPDKHVLAKEEAQAVEEGGSYNWDKANKSHLIDTLHNRMLRKKALPSKGPSREALKKLAAQSTHVGAKIKEEAELEEKTLTPAEMKKREQVAKALKREHPGMPMAKKMAIATATAKKVAEETVDEALGTMSNIKAATKFGMSNIAKMDREEKARKASLSPKQQKIASLAGDKEKIDSEDLAKLRSMKKEEVEQIDELSRNTIAKYHDASWLQRRQLKTKHSSIYGTDPEKQKQIDKRERGLALAQKKMYKFVHKEELELEEAVTVKKSTHSWGKMVTVHHGSSHSFPLHPEHQEAIAKLEDGESTSFTDETKSKVTAHREGDTVHLSHRGSNTKTPVAMSHFKEEVELDEAKRGRPRKDGTKPAGDDDSQEADKNIHTQLHKVISANKPVTFNNGKTHQITSAHAHKALSMLQNAKSSDRLAIQHSLAHSHDRFHETLKSGKAITDAPRPKVSLAKSVKEDVDPSTTRADRGDIKSSVRINADGRPVLVRNREPRKEIKVEAVEITAASVKAAAATQYAKGQTDKENMQQDSLNKLKTDPLANKEKIETLPPTQGNKPIGGEEQTHTGKFSVAEEALLNNLYDTLSEENKIKFDQMLETREGIEFLIKFAQEQGL